MGGGADWWTNLLPGHHNSRPANYKRNSAFHDAKTQESCLETTSISPTFIQELTDLNFNSRWEARARMVRTLDTIPTRRKIIFSDECVFYRSCRSQNIVFWSKKNPHYYFEEMEYSFNVIMWTNTDNKRLFGPYFFDGPVNQQAYLCMLKSCLVPQL